MFSNQNKLSGLRCLICLVIGLIFFPSCQKEGPMGLPGTNGTDGKDGSDGNANVKSGTITLTNADWKWYAYWSYAGNGISLSLSTRYADINTPLVTQEIEDKGSVQVFIRNNLGWTPLPFRFQEINNTYQTNIVHEFYKGKIRLHYFYTANQTGVSLPSLQNAVINTYNYKYVIIAAD